MDLGQDPVTAVIVEALLTCRRPLQGFQSSPRAISHLHPRWHVFRIAHVHTQRPRNQSSRLLHVHPPKGYHRIRQTQVTLQHYHPPQRDCPLRNIHLLAQLRMEALAQPLPQFYHQLPLCHRVHSTRTFLRLSSRLRVRDQTARLLVNEIVS